MAATLRPLGLTHVQFVLLASLWYLAEVTKETPTQRRLAEHAGTDLMMTSQVLRALEGHGLVTRTPDPSDARARLIRLTERGAVLATQALALVEAADARYFATASGRRTIIEFLRELSEAGRD